MTESGKTVLEECQTGARLSWRRLVVVVAGFEALAFALWLVPASVQMVDWPEAGPVRAALFAPRAPLVWLVLIALAVAAWAIARTKSPGACARLGRAARALCLLWVWAIPYLPWLPDRLPMLLVLAGPLRWVIAGLVACAAIVGVVGPESRPDSRPPVRLERSTWRLLVFAASLILYSGLGILNARVVGPGGDEPHYLIISQSLLADGDLRIEDNHRRREYRAFWGGELRPDYMKRGIDGEIYSIHAPGLPVVLLPAYAAVGYQGAVVMLCLMAALTSLAIFDLAYLLAGPMAAFAAWTAVCLTVPFVPYAWLIFPEIPGALVVAWSALWLWQPLPDRVTRWIWRGVALAVLPWLHTKFVIFLALFGTALVWRIRVNFRATAAFLLPIVVSLAGWLYFFYTFYGSFNPEAPYGDYPAINVLAKNIPRGLLGLMFDQKFGLFFYSPIYLFAAAGSWLIVRRSDTRLLGMVLLLVTAAHVGSTTRLYMWWGGTSAPARFLGPILPCLAPMMALQASAIKSRTSRTLFGVCLFLSLLIATIGAFWPGRLFLFSDSRGYARLLEIIQAGAPLTFSLPTFTYEDWVTPIKVLVPWLLAAALATGAMVAATRWLRLTPLWTVAVGSLTLVASADVLAGRPGAGAREELSRRGALDLIWRYDGSRLRAFEYKTLRKIDETRVRDVGRVTFHGHPTSPFALPQGAYEARVWFGGTFVREGEIAVVSADRVTFARRTGALANPATVPFDLPIAVGRLSVAVSDKEVAASVSRIEIVPTVMTSRSAREARAARRIEAIPERPQGYLIYIDEHAYPEGGVFWTRGTERAEVLVAPGPHSRIRLTLHLGPRSGDVQVSSPGEQRSVRVEAGRTAEIQLDVPRGLRLVPLVIQSPAMFRPAEVDAGSDDTRLLGVQVRVGLE